MSSSGVKQHYQDLGQCRIQNLEQETEMCHLEVLFVYLWSWAFNGVSCDLELDPRVLRPHLVKHLRHMFSVFKHYMHFYTLFYSHVLQKNTNNITHTPLPNEF